MAELERKKKIQGHFLCCLIEFELYSILSTFDMPENLIRRALRQEKVDVAI